MYEIKRDQRTKEIIQRNAKITRFITRLYLILKRSEKEAKISSLIRWEANGRFFVIPEVKPFLALLKSHFKLTNYNSFVRQLNIYGFRRIPNYHCIAFKNKFFRQKHEQDLIRIQRKEEIKNKSLIIQPTPLRVANERALSRYLFMKNLDKKPSLDEPNLVPNLIHKKETLLQSNFDLKAKCKWLCSVTLELMNK